jgi:hypothetical protein
MLFQIVFSGFLYQQGEIDFYDRYDLDEDLLMKIMQNTYQQGKKDALNDTKKHFVLGNEPKDYTILHFFSSKS